MSYKITDQNSSKSFRSWKTEWSVVRLEETKETDTLLRWDWLPGQEKRSCKGHYWDNLWNLNKNSRLDKVLYQCYFFLILTIMLRWHTGVFRDKGVCCLQLVLRRAGESADRRWSCLQNVTAGRSGWRSLGSLRKRLQISRKFAIISRQLQNNPKRGVQTNTNENKMRLLNSSFHDLSRAWACSPLVKRDEQNWGRLNFCWDFLLEVPRRTVEGRGG